MSLLKTCDLKTAQDDCSRSKNVKIPQGRFIVFFFLSLIYFSILLLEMFTDQIHRGYGEIEAVVIIGQDIGSARLGF